MSKIGFLTDSCSDIPQELADKYGIEVVGFPINLDGVEYMERKDFTNDQFYQMMRDAQGVPTTAAITQLQFCDIYARYVDEGYTDLVYLSINAGGSSTYNNAIKAIELLEEERPGFTMKIQIIDSQNYSMPYGWYFCECARKVRNGGELAACVGELKQKLDCVEICLAAYSLKQMKKSGRISAAAAVVGDLLGIRPIISLNAGVSKVEAKVRGDAAVPAAMLKWVESRVDSMKDTPYMVAYTSSTAKRDELAKLCRKAFGHPPLIVFQLGGVVSANTGPDAIAIVYEGHPRNLEGGQNLSAGVLYEYEKNVRQPSGALRCHRGRLCGGLSGACPVQLWGGAGARGRGTVPAAGFRRGVHHRRHAGLPAGEPAGLHRH